MRTAKSKNIYVNNIDRARDPANDLSNELVEGTSLCPSLGHCLSGTTVIPRAATLSCRVR